jgi:hypothetical protein
MSAAEKYGRPVESISTESLAEVRAAGQVLADKGVTFDAGAQQSPAVKYGAPANNQHEKSLSRERSL